MFIAVVYKHHADTDPQSHRPGGGWEAFLDYSKDGAVKQALAAAQRYENTPSFSSGTGAPKVYGPYQVLVGELTEEADRFPVKLSRIDEYTNPVNAEPVFATADDDIPF